MKKSILAVMMFFGLMGSAFAVAPVTPFIVTIVAWEGGRLAIKDSLAQDKCFSEALVTEAAKGGSYLFTSTAREAGTCK